MVKDSALNERATAVEIGGLVDGVGAPVMRAGYALKAKPSWITLSAVEGTGNSQVDVTAPVYKGRNGRSGLITVAVEDLTEDVTLQQEGSTIWDVTTQSLAFVKGGEAKKFIGNSNLAAITFAVDSDASEWLTAGKLMVNEKNTTLVLRSKVIREQMTFTLSKLRLPLLLTRRLTLVPVTLP